MARIVWSGSPLPQRRAGGSVYWASPTASLQRQGGVPVRAGHFQSVKASNALGYAAYVWASVLTTTERDNWNIAAPHPLSGYAYFLQLNLPPITFLYPYTTVAYTPTNYVHNALLIMWTDTVLQRAFVGYFGDFGTAPSPPLNVAIYLQLSSLWSRWISAHSSTPGRFIRPGSGYVAFGTLGPLVLNDWVYGDITDAVLAVFGQLPQNIFYPNALGYQQGGGLEAMVTYMDDAGVLSTIVGALRTRAGNAWVPLPDYVMGVPPSSLAHVAPSARTAGFIP